MDLDMLLTYLDFVQGRHQVWTRRQEGWLQEDWTDDPILASQKFTNVFRVLDPGSQYVYALDTDDPVDTALRLFLYRHTGRTEAWRWLDLMAGLPTAGTLQETFDAWCVYRGEGVTKLQKKRPYVVRTNKAGGYQSTTYQRKMFTGAYLVFPQSQEPGTDKLQSIIELVQRLVDNGSFERFVTADQQDERFEALRANRGVADFMSMQILTDWGYTRHADADREDEFVVCGPGATRGAAHVAPTWKAPQTLELCHRALHRLDDPPRVVVSGGRERLPSYMDVQNTLCEFSKYVRYASRPLKTAPYRPAHPGPQPAPVFPKHW